MSRWRRWLLRHAGQRCCRSRGLAGRHRRRDRRLAAAEAGASSRCWSDRLRRRDPRGLGRAGSARWRCARRRLPQFLKRKLRETYPHLSGKDCDLVERGLRQFFLACLRSNCRFVAMPSRAVDAIWHEFILRHPGLPRLVRSACSAASCTTRRPRRSVPKADDQRRPAARLVLGLPATSRSIRKRRRGCRCCSRSTPSCGSPTASSIAADCGAMRGGPSRAAGGDGNVHCGTSFADGSFGGDADSMGGVERRRRRQRRCGRGRGGLRRRLSVAATPLRGRAGDRASPQPPREPVRRPWPASADADRRAAQSVVGLQVRQRRCRRQRARRPAGRPSRRSRSFSRVSAMSRLRIVSWPMRSCGEKLDSPFSIVSRSGL